MSSEKFETLADDLSVVLDELKSKIDRRIPNYVGEERKSAIRLAERSLDEANLMFQEMETEAKLAPPTFRPQMLGQLRNYRREVELVTKNLRRITLGVGVQEPSGFDREDRLAFSNRSKIIKGSESLNAASESIARSHQIASETDQIGTEIISDLGTQREQLVRTRDRLHDTDSNLSRSRKILNTMARRVITNKMILIVIILVELAILAGVTYWKFFS